MAETDGLLREWNSNPKPLKSEGDGRIVLDCGDVTASAYLWDVKNSSEGWLSFDGELVDIEQ